MGWDERHDVVVVGTGNGGLTAALCLNEMGVKDVLVIDSSDQVGGTSALSGGGIWVPANHLAAEAGASDSYEDALRYVLATDPDGEVPVPLVEAYLKEAPRMLRFLEERTEVRYRSLAQYPDYFSDLPGARPGHRSLEPEPVTVDRLDGDGDTVREPHPILCILGRIPMTQTEAHLFNGQGRGWKWQAAKLVLSYLTDVRWRWRSRRARRATCGNAGIARLLWSLQQRHVPVRLSTELVDLVVEGGRVSGVAVRRNGVLRRIEAGRGVVLASGGFEQNQEMRERYLPKPTDAGWSTTHKGNKGTPLAIAARHGAGTARMDGAWWVPTFRVPGVPYAYPSIMEKSYPGSIVVNRDGRRIANESMNYQSYVRACHAAQANGCDVSALWLIFDARFRRRYIVSPILTSRLMPDWMIPSDWFCPEFLARASSLGRLAAKIGVDPAGLRASVDRMNVYAETGKDAEFGRGDAHYDRYYGDPSVTPNPCLAPICEAPFYAVRIYLGEFGTNGGLDITSDGQVRMADGRAFEGLYATGNCARPILPAYPGPGSTLGPAMTFAYLAARHISRRNQADADPTDARAAARGGRNRPQQPAHRAAAAALATTTPDGGKA